MARKRIPNTARLDRSAANHPRVCTARITLGGIIYLATRPETDTMSDARALARIAELAREALADLHPDAPIEPERAHTCTDYTEGCPACLTRERACAHRCVTLVGNEETGLRAAVCDGCKVPMSRREVDGEYTYEPRADLHRHTGAHDATCPTCIDSAPRESEVQQ